MKQNKSITVQGRRFAVKFNEVGHMYSCNVTGSLIGRHSINELKEAIRKHLHEFKYCASVISRADSSDPKLFGYVRVDTIAELKNKARELGKNCGRLRLSCTNTGREWNIDS